MWPLLSNGLRDLLIQPHCPVCQKPVDTSGMAAAPCDQCMKALGLPEHPLEGSSPLRWLAAAAYEGRFRTLLLQLRQHRKSDQIAALSWRLRSCLPSHAVLVPVPNWKQASRRNPLPELLMHALDREHLPLLQRRRPCLGQHHLNRQQRWQNQQHSFGCDLDAARGMIWNSREAWIVDDIVTTGSTACAAASALRQSGIPVAGVVCLGRTPAQVRRQTAVL